MNIKKVLIIGGGVLGSQIAFQSAYCGFDVTIYSRKECSMDHTKEKIENLKKTYIDAINKMAKSDGKNFSDWCNGISTYKKFDKKECLKKVESAYENIKHELNMADALKGKDLVIEAMAENLEQKRELYKNISNLMDEKTLVVTNSSTLLPSKLAKYTGRPEKFLALHFANSIWKNNTAEVMVHPKTNMDNFNTIIKFAEKINMVAIPLKKEKSGYVLNSMLVPFLFSALDLVANGISDVESIDKTWKLGTGAPNGPFEILDVVGLTTAYNIVESYLNIPSFLAPYNFKAIAKLLKSYMDQGKLGRSTKEGFYKYK